MMMDKKDTSHQSFQSFQERIKNISAGMHACYFYQTKEDLLDVLIPYFTDGLANNEFCLWVCTKSLLPAIKAAAHFLKHCPLSDPEKYIRSGQIQILESSQWYYSLPDPHSSDPKSTSSHAPSHALSRSQSRTPSRTSHKSHPCAPTSSPSPPRFHPELVLRRVHALLNEVFHSDYKGIRASGDTSWLSEESWQPFMDYEEYVNNTLPNFHSRALCTYPLSQCSPPDIIDVVNRHQLSLLKTPTGWKLWDHNAHSPHRSGSSKSPKSSFSFPAVDIDAGANSSKSSSPAYRHPDQYLTPNPDDTPPLPFSPSILSAREDERKKISMSLHSSIGSLSISLSAKLHKLEEELKSLNLRVGLKDIAETREVFQSEVKRIKQQIYSIRPPELDYGGFDAAVQSRLSELAKEKKVDFHFHCDPSCRNLTDYKAIILYRIAHEAVNNVLNHSGSKSLEMSLSPLKNSQKHKNDYKNERKNTHKKKPEAGLDDKHTNDIHKNHPTSILLTIQDKGCGFDHNKLSSRTDIPQSFGLYSMNQMAKSIGGTFRIQSSPGKGTKITVEFLPDNPNNPE